MALFLMPFSIQMGSPSRPWLGLGLGLRLGLRLGLGLELGVAHHLHVAFVHECLHRGDDLIVGTP